MIPKVDEHLHIQQVIDGIIQGNISRQEAEELANRIDAYPLRNGLSWNLLDKPIETDPKKWTQEYLYTLRFQAISGWFGRRSLLHIADVSAHLRQKEKLRRWTWGLVLAGAAVILIAAVLIWIWLKRK